MEFEKVIELFNSGEYEKILKTASLFTKETLLYHCRVLDETSFAMQKAGASKRTVAEMALIRMCDNSLDDKTDSILSRISKLENAIAIGAFSNNTLMKSINNDVKKVIVEDNPEEKIVDNKEMAASQETLKALRGWNEIVEQATAGDDSTLGFLKMAKAFSDGIGQIYIRFPNQFAMDMALSKKNLKADLRAALCILLKKQLVEENIHYGIFEGNENELEELDDLNIN